MGAAIPGMSESPPHETFIFEGRTIPFRPGDSVATALLWAGVRTTSRSVKYRRARGPSCLGGDCGTCLCRVDGRPNVRACTTPPAPRMVVAAQNVLWDASFDPADLVGERAPEIDHHHMFVRPRPANEVMKRVARHLAGLGTLPDDPAPIPPPEDIACDVLVVGAGPAGRAAAEHLAAAGLDVVCVDRDRHGAEDAPAWLRRGFSIFGIYPAEGVVAGTAPEGRAERLVRVRPRIVVLATGSRARLPVVPGNDLPGLVSASALATACRRTERPPPEGTVCIVDGAEGRAVAARLGVPAIPIEDVVRLEGRRELEAVRTRSARVDAHVAAYAVGRIPRDELARQAGVVTSFDGSGFVPKRAPDGRLVTSSPLSFALYGCGDLCGPGHPERAAEDGHRTATRILAALEGRPA
ncbi:MAG: hypothetical protein D6705_12965 [Deltaproteobacteria bacterium]|nr:MAG: hypothetical protein D6705_12965 [Deltaproteobacteria bacterium]